MQALSPDYLPSLSGSHQPIVEVDAWVNGRLAVQNLLIVDGSLTKKAGQSIQGELNLTVADGSGALLPVIGSPLSPFGAELNVRAGMQRGPVRDVCSLGWFPIKSAKSRSSWVTYRSEFGDETKVNRGGQVFITGADRLRTVQRTGFTSATQSVAGTVFAEAARILRGVVGWIAPAGVTDRPIKTQLTYTDDRLAALTALAELVECDLSVTPSGAVTMVRQVSTSPAVWTIPRGDSAANGLQVSLDFEVSSENIANAVIARGATDFTGQPLQATVYDRTPGVAWGSAFGRIPRVINVDQATDLASLVRAATAELVGMQRQRWLTLQVQSPANYALEIGDMVRVGARTGSTDGQVGEISWPLPATAGGTMTVGVSVDPFDLMKVM